MTTSAHLFTIGELAERSGVRTSTLRYYETEGLIASQRTEGNQRRYLRQTLRRVAFIRAAQVIGLPLREIVAALGTLPKSRTPNRSDWEKLSSAWRPMLDSRIAELERLKDSLNGCIACGCLSLETCELFNAGDYRAAQGPGARQLVGNPVQNDPA